MSSGRTQSAWPSARAEQSLLPLMPRLIWVLSILCNYYFHLMTPMLPFLRNPYCFPNNVYWALHVDYGYIITITEVSLFLISKHQTSNRVSREDSQVHYCIFSRVWICLCTSTVNEWMRVLAKVLFSVISTDGLFFKD